MDTNSINSIINNNHHYSVCPDNALPLTRANVTHCWVLLTTSQTIVHVSIKHHNHHTLTGRVKGGGYRRIHATPSYCQHVDDQSNNNHMLLTMTKLMFLVSSVISAMNLLLPSGIIDFYSGH